MCLACSVFNPFQLDGNWLHEFGSENALAISETTDAAGNTSTGYSMSSGDTFSGPIGFYRTLITQPFNQVADTFKCIWGA